MIHSDKIELKYFCFGAQVTKNTTVEKREILYTVAPQKRSHCYCIMDHFKSIAREGTWQRSWGSHQVQYHWGSKIVTPFLSK